MASNSSSTDSHELFDRISSLMPQVRADLERLVRIPSINGPGYDPAPVRECADACAELLRAAGADVEVIGGPEDAPTVRADLPGPPGAPTVLLYSHYDVQPGGDDTKWDSPPFDPTERAGRLYGRGAADDKSGVVTHIACVRAFGATPPVTLRILLEGAEEFGGAFEEWPRTHPDQFAGIDAAVINDMGPVELGLPTFTTALRGIVDGVVTVRTLAEPRHSGMCGGPAPDALMALITLLSTLVDDNGDCAIDGIPGSDWPGADYPEQAYRAVAGVLPDVPLIGSGSIASRLFSRPSVNVVGLDAPPVDTAPNALVPMARAKVSVRIPAGVDPNDAMAALEQHLRNHAPWGLAIQFEHDAPAPGTLVATGGRAYQAYARAMRAAYGTEPTEQGVGGAVPFLANLIDEFPDLEVVGTGAQDPLARIHAPNESVDLTELERSIRAQALFLAEYGSLTHEHGSLTHEHGSPTHEHGSPTHENGSTS